MNWSNARRVKQNLAPGKSLFPESKNEKSIDETHNRSSCCFGITVIKPFFGRCTKYAGCDACWRKAENISQLRQGRVALARSLFERCDRACATSEGDNIFVEVVVVQAQSCPAAGRRGRNVFQCVLLGSICSREYRLCVYGLPMELTRSSAGLQSFSIVSTNHGLMPESCDPTCTGGQTKRKMPK